MIITLVSLLLINLFLSIDNILPIIFLSKKLPNKREQTIALFIGLVGGALMRVILILCAGYLFKFGAVIYVIAGVFLLYVGIHGLYEIREKDKDKEVATSVIDGSISQKAATFFGVIVSIAFVDVSLSVDNTAALLAITREFSLLFIGTLLCVAILFILSFSINALIERVKGLETAAYLAILFLALTFLVYPFKIYLNDTIISVAIILICAITVIFATTQSNKKDSI